MVCRTVIVIVYPDAKVKERNERPRTGKDELNSYEPSNGNVRKEPHIIGGPGCSKAFLTAAVVAKIGRHPVITVVHPGDRMVLGSRAAFARKSSDVFRFPPRPASSCGTLLRSAITNVWTDFREARWFAIWPPCHRETAD